MQLQEIDEEKQTSSHIHIIMSYESNTTISMYNIQDINLMT